MTPTDAPPDRRERNRRRVREALRTAALELFSEKGFAETTVTDITGSSRMRV
ncbi:MAG: TetR family transcriptional regulator [Microbacterium ginsengisoli]|nr:TetR family transcriptional regulator [Microbacterium ginsengisoli]